MRRENIVINNSLFELSCFSLPLSPLCVRYPLFEQLMTYMLSNLKRSIVTFSIGSSEFEKVSY
jgi:hypothetical protein